MFESIPWDKIANIANAVVTVVGLVGVPLAGWILKSVLFPKWELERKERFLSVLSKVYDYVEAISEKTGWQGDDKLAAALKALGDDLSAKESAQARAFFAGQAQLKKKADL